MAKKTITGTVTTNDTGEPLIGAYISIVGVYGVTAATDTEGKYEIRAEEGSEIMVSYTGYQSKREFLGTQRILDFVLEFNDLMDE